MRWDELGAEGDPSAGRTLPKGCLATGAELGAGNGVHFTSFYYSFFASVAFFLNCLFPKSCRPWVPSAYQENYLLP